MNKKLIGHNQPPLQLEDFLILDADGNSTGRIKFTNTVIRKHLTRKLDAKQQYVERVINDSEKIGLKAKINPGRFVKLITDSKGDIRSMINSAQALVTGFEPNTEKSFESLNVEDGLNAFFKSQSLDEARVVLFSLRIDDSFSK